MVKLNEFLHSEEAEGNELNGDCTDIIADIHNNTS